MELLVPPLTSTTLGGLNAPSSGRKRAERTIVPARPFTLVREMVTVVDDPGVNVVLLGLAVMLKSAGPLNGEV